MMTNLQERREAIEGRLRVLRGERGVAVLDGADFPNAVEIVALEGELASLDDAAGEQARRAREEASAAWRAHLQKQREALARVEEQRLDAWNDAEEACRALRQALQRIIENSVLEATVARDLGPVPFQLQRPDVASRIGGRLASVLATLPGHRARIGALELKGAGGLYPPSQSWREHEAALLKNHIEQLIGKGHDNGKEHGED